MEGIIPLPEHRVRIQKEIEGKLRASLQEQQDLPIQQLQAFRKREEQRLKLWHRGGGGGKEIAALRTEMVDILLREIFRHAVRKSTGGTELPGSLVCAFGGYGRRELNPFSDVDIMFLHEAATPTPEMEKAVSTTLMTLWDLGFKVGHATRSIKAAIDQANRDMVTKTAMMESRWLAGDKKTFDRFKDQFTAKCVRGRETEYMAWRLDSLKDLRHRYGGSVFMQEPNVKSGCGGLRDYQNLHWMGMFHSGAPSMRKLVEEKILLDKERKILEEAHDFLLKVRTEMHYQTGRSSDQLTLRLQGKVATALGYSQRHILRRCEAFMKDYYRHTRETHLITTVALGRLKELADRRTGFLKKILPIRVEKTDGFLIRSGRIFPSSGEIFSGDPLRMMRAFRLAQGRQLGFSTELGDLVKRSLHLVDRTFQYNKENRLAFLAILSRKGEVGRVLRLMHDLGFLGKFLPEFEPLTCLVQHEFYHRYTADEHTLLCIDKIDELLFTENPKLSPYTQIFRHLDDPATLYLAMLLHDTGKAANTRHHEEASAIAAQKVARRLQLEPQRRKMLIALVDSHGELGSVARSRNLEDPATVEAFARVIRDPVTLDALMILTLADGMGTSDEGWSDWKEQLVWQLYKQARKFLVDSDGYREERRARREEHLRAVCTDLPEDFHAEIEAHFSGMPERYLQSREAGEISAHIRQFRKLFRQIIAMPGAQLDPVVEWTEHPEAGHAVVTVCCWDRERLLERISAAFLNAGINVLGADVYTRPDHLALDIFRVSNHRSEPLPRERDRKKFEESLRRMLRGPGDHPGVLTPSEPGLRRDETPREEQDLPVRVFIDNSTHPTCTLLEIQAPDRMGLLYHLLRAISHGGISIEAARIATEQQAALDVFYIRGRDGNKITAKPALMRLERRLRTAAVRTEKP